MNLKIKALFKRVPVIYSVIFWLKQKIMRSIYHIAARLFIFLPIKKNKITISNYYGKGYGDNGKYIAEEIIRRGLDYDIVWLLKKDFYDVSKFPRTVRKVKYGSVRGLYELATSKVWIDNCRKLFHPPKRKKQFYIQTWHGGIGVKYQEKEAENKLSKSYVNFGKNDSKMADLFISNSTWCTENYRNSFWYEGNIEEIGSPRNDVLLIKNNEIKESIVADVKKKLKIEEDFKIVLYAPTFRNDSGLSSYDLEYDKLLEKLSEKFTGDWVVIVRLHPNISQKGSHLVYNDRIINGTDYQDLQELLLASDVYITDFSSPMFEFILTRKPIFLYCNDYDEYVEERGFKIDARQIGFSFATTKTELYENIENFDNSNYQKTVDRVLHTYGYKEQGNASELLVNIIKDQIEM